ncbi:MAG: nucleotidyltransferase domain-containing protein, partial [Flavobacteriales bacterium]
MKHHKIITQVEQRIAALDGIEAAVLYGSVARGEATPNSDIDLGIIVNDRFDRDALIEAFKGMELQPDHVMPVSMRNKVVAYFQDMRIKLEVALHHDLASFGRDLSGSVIPEHLLPNAVLLDRTGTLVQRILDMNGSGYKPYSVEELVQKFIYEFDNLSTFHR